MLVRAPEFSKAPPEATGVRLGPGDGQVARLGLDVGRVESSSVIFSTGPNKNINT